MVREFLRIREWVFKDGESMDMYIGIPNINSDGSRNLFADADNVPLNLLLRHLPQIQEKYQLPHIYLFHTSPWHWYIASFSSKKWSEIQEIMKLMVKLGLACPGYVHYSQKKGYSVLRVCPKLGLPITPMYVLKSNGIKENLNQKRWFIKQLKYWHSQFLLNCSHHYNWESIFDSYTDLLSPQRLDYESLSNIE